MLVVAERLHDIALASGGNRVKHSENNTRAASKLKCGDWFMVHTSARRRGQAVLWAMTRSWEIWDFS